MHVPENLDPAIRKSEEVCCIYGRIGSISARGTKIDRDCTCAMQSSPTVLRIIQPQHNNYSILV